jgi:hypothetical protein
VGTLEVDWHRGGELSICVRVYTCVITAAVTSRRDREQWYRLTMGREVDAKYFMGSAADPAPPSEALSMLAHTWVAEWLPAAPDQGAVANGGGAATTATAVGGAGGTQTGTASAPGLPGLSSSASLAVYYRL